MSDSIVSYNSNNGIVENTLPENTLQSKSLSENINTNTTTIHEDNDNTVVNFIHSDFLTYEYLELLLKSLCVTNQMNLHASTEINNLVVEIKSSKKTVLDLQLYFQIKLYQCQQLLHTIAYAKYYFYYLWLIEEKVYLQIILMFIDNKELQVQEQYNQFNFLLELSKTDTFTL